MLTTTMDQPSCDYTSSPFQARALLFLKKLALRARGTPKKRGDALSPVTIPTQNFRPHSLDLFRKPDISRLIGFRAEGGPNPMDADDSSQDASASSNSPHLRPRRHSTWDSLGTGPFHSTFAGHGPAPLFLRDQPGLGSKCLVHDSGNVLAPAPLFLRSNVSNVSLDAVVQAPDSEIPPRICASSEPQPDDQGVQVTLNDVTPRPPEGIHSHDSIPPASLTGQAASTSSEQGILSRTLTTEDFTSSAFHERPPLLPRHTAPLPPFRVTTQRGLRLSPSIVTRQPMPLLNLPPLPPPPPTSDPVPRQKVPLRHMPSLSLHGRSNIDCQADRENATLGDSDEEDAEGDEEEERNDTSSIHQSDDDDDDDELPSAAPSCIPGLKSLQKRPMVDNGSTVEDLSSSISIENNDLNHSNYLRSETYVEPASASFSTSAEMYPFSPNVAIADDFNRGRTLDSGLSKPAVRLESKPGLYRVASRSMINLGSTRHTEREVTRVKSRETVRSNQGSASTEVLAESEESDTEEVIGRLIRRTSMPSFHPTSNPPPYPTFNPRPKESLITPREDEGRERLPTYSNALYLIAVMPRKMEFNSPGVQAKDRKWRRVVCELEGTTFRVYRCPPGASGGGALGDWWEKHVGVGDVASPDSRRTRKKEEPPERTVKLDIDDTATPTTPLSGRSTSVPPPRQRRESQSSMATMMSTPRRIKRTSATSFLSPFRSSSFIRPDASAADPVRPAESGELGLLPVDVQDSRSSSPHESGQSTPVGQRPLQQQQPRSASRISFFPVATSRVQLRLDEVRKPPQSDMLHAYTLQHAESGLGNDYLKRKNVIRVRLEGEQFLLQAPDVPSVVEWIEGLHAGTNIALDIDERPMPRGPLFPRRRRRRTRRATVEGENI